MLRERVKDSEHANLVTIDAMRVVSGLVNRNATPLDDVRVRRPLNLAVDRGRLIREVFFGYALPVAAMAPPYSRESPDATSSPTRATPVRSGGSCRRPGGRRGGP